MSAFQELVEKELKRARAKYQNTQCSWHEGEAILREEFEEVVKEVRKKNHLRRNDLLLKELVQVGAMAQRFAEDAELL